VSQEAADLAPDRASIRGVPMRRAPPPARLQEGLEAPPEEELPLEDEVSVHEEGLWDDDDEDEDLSLAAVFKQQSIGDNDAVVSPPPKPSRPDALAAAQQHQQQVGVTFSPKPAHAGWQGGAARSLARSMHAPAPSRRTCRPAAGLLRAPGA